MGYGQAPAHGVLYLLQNSGYTGGESFLHCPSWKDTVQA